MSHHQHHQQQPQQQQQQRLRQPFTVEEKSAYGSLFKSLDKEGLGIVTGEVARPIFEKSGLSTTLLREIWQLADSEGNGFLTEFAFFVSLRLIGHCQNGGRPTVELMNISGPLANLNQGAASASAASAPPPINRHVSAAPSSRLSSFQTTGPIFPPLTPLDVNKFSQLFQRSAQGGNLKGDLAKNIFMKANLPNVTLGQIWNVVDREQSGNLSQQEFIIAMYLIQSTINGSMKQIPQFVPNAIWDLASAVASPLKRIPLAVPPHRTPSVQGRNTSAQSRTSVNSSGATSPPASDWVISASQKQQFDSIFDNLDKKKSGTLSPNEVAQFLMTSNLPQDTLGTIWDLADVENAGEFTKKEFSIALYLVNRKMSGGDLPNIVPESLIHSADQFVTSQRNSSVTHNPAAAQPPQFKTQSSINDLASLNDLFTSPVVTPTIPKATTKISPIKPALTSSLTGSRPPFVPSSSFGQQMLSDHLNDQRQEPPSLLEESEDEDEGPISAEPSRSFSNRPTVPAREQKPNFSGDNSSGANYNALRSFTTNNQAQGGFSSQPVQTNTFSSQTVQRAPTAPIASTNTDLLADSEVSGQLSLATTDIANISNQINSLTTQTTQLNEKRERASGELNRILLLKKDIESKLTKLRALYDQEVKQVQEVESVLVQSKQETEALQKEAALTEANYHATQAKLQQSQVQYEESQKEIETLKAKLGVMNAENIELKNQHEQLLSQQKQSASMLSVVQQQVNVLESKNVALRSDLEKTNKDINSIETEHVNARNTLDSLKAEIPMLTAAISAAAATFAMTKSLLKGTNSRIDYHSQQKRDLEAQHLQFQQVSPTIEAQDGGKDIQDVSLDTAESLENFNKARSVDSRESNTLAASSAKNTTETPASSVAGSDIQYAQQYQNFNLPLERPQSTTSSVLNNPSLSVRGEDNVSQPASPSSIEEEIATPTATISNQMQPHTEQRSQDYVAQSYGEVPGTSQTSSAGESFELVEAENDDTTIKRQDTNEQLADNEVFNQVENPSSSDLTIKLHDLTTDERNAQVDDPAADEEPQLAKIPGAFITSPVQSKSVEFETPVTKDTTAEEFPPIKELNYDESDSSEDNDSFHDTNNISVSKSTDDDGRDTFDDAMDQFPVSNKDEFDDLNPAVVELAGTTDVFDEFDNLEEALPEMLQELQIADFEDEPDSAFSLGFSDSTTAIPAQSNDLFGDLEPSTTETNNDEWEQLFEGFGNSNTANFDQPQLATAVTAKVVRSPQVVPVVGSYQSSQAHELAIKELTGMGFSEKAVIEALNLNDWNLPNATNHLLDNA